MNLRKHTAGLFLALPFLYPACAWGAPRIESIQTEPNVVFVKEPTKVIFRARLMNDTGQPPQRVDLMRLEGDGNESIASTMQDDGRGPDQVKNDGIYTAIAPIKEPYPGILSFTVQVMFLDISGPVRSRPAFINIASGVDAKDKKAILKIQKKAQKMYKDLTRRKGQVQARKETVTWLTRQPGVINIRELDDKGLYVQFNANVAMVVQPPPSIKEEPSK